MPLINKQPFKPNPIPNNLNPDDEVFYHELTNEIFTCHDEFFDRFLYCNSLIWTCCRTGKSGLTYKEALDSELQGIARKKKKKCKRESQEEINGEAEVSTISNLGDDNVGLPVKKKKKKYPYDPKKYSMPVPEGFDPSLLTPTGKIDGRKLKSKKNKQLAEELLSTMPVCPASSTENQSKKGKHKKNGTKRKEDEVKKKEEDTKKKAQAQAELAKERELEVKRKKEAAALIKQLERQKKEEERKKAAAFLQNWEKKCEDLERDDLRRLPQPTPLVCDIPEKLFGNAIFILESLFNLHELYNFGSIFPEGISYDVLEDMLIDRQEDGPLGVIVQFLLRLIFDTQPTSDGYGLDDDPTKPAAADSKLDASKTPHTKVEKSDPEGEQDDNEHRLGIDHEEDEENVDKDVNMNDLIGSAIKAAQEVKKSLSKPLPEMEITSENMTEILRLHFLQSGSFPKGRTIYNGWYSSREDPGLWLCMQEPDLIKKLSEGTIYNLDIEERIKILHTLIYQLFSFIKTRTYIESASDQLTELRKEYRGNAAAFARWDRENCVKRMQPPKRKGEQGTTSDKSNGLSDHIKSEQKNQSSNPCSINGDMDVEAEGSENGTHLYDKDSSNNLQLKSCLKTNGTGSADVVINDSDDATHSKKKITFKTSMNGAIRDNGLDDCENDHMQGEKNHNGIGEDNEQNFEELERAYQQNQVDYEDYQRERAIKYEELNELLLSIRTTLRNTQSIYGVHPIGRDRAYRRYWLFQSLPGLFVEQDDEYLGKCLPGATPLESRYKKLFNKENPLMHPNEADLIRTKTCDVGCSTEAMDHSPEDQSTSANNIADHQDKNGNDGRDSEENASSDKLNEVGHDDIDDNESEALGITDEMSYCTGDEATCAIHGRKRPTQPRWWFYHTTEAIDSLIESLNKRGYRESELHDLLATESTILKPWVAECPAYKLNKTIMEQSGIRRSRRLKTKGTKRRGRKVEYE